MDNTQASLQKTYEGMSTPALLELHAAGTLTDSAYAVLESVLHARSIPVPARPDTDKQKTPFTLGAMFCCRRSRGSGAVSVTGFGADRVEGTM